MSAENGLPASASGLGQVGQGSQPFALNDDQMQQVLRSMERKGAEAPRCDLVEQVVLSGTLRELRMTMSVAKNRRGWPGPHKKRCDRIAKHGRLLVKEIESCPTLFWNIRPPRLAEMIHDIRQVTERAERWARHRDTGSSKVDWVVNNLWGSLGESYELITGQPVGLARDDITSPFGRFLRKCHEIVGVPARTLTKINLFIKNHWKKTAFFKSGKLRGQK